MDIEDIVKSWAKLFNASEEERKEADRRLEICKKCQRISNIGVCRDCGCPVTSKVFTRNPCKHWNL